MFLSILIFSSCDKSEVGALDDSMPQVIDGRVTFSSEKSLQNFMTGLATNDEVAEKLPSTFVSSAQAVGIEFQRLESIENETDIDFVNHPILYVDVELSEVRPIVPDGPFAGLLNEDLELRIGDEVYVFGPSTAKVFAMNTDKTLTFTREFDIQYEILSATADIEPDDSSDLNSRASSCLSYINHETRMKGELQKNNFGVWAEFRFVTKTQKKRWGLWHRNKSSRVTVSGTARGFYCTGQYWGPTSFTGTINKFNASSVDAAVGEIWSAYCGDDGAGTHSASRDGFFPFCTTSR